MPRVVRRSYMVDGGNGSNNGGNYNNESNERSMGRFMDTSKITSMIVFALCVLVACIIGPSLYENVRAGTFHITQNPFTGTIKARMTPGPYCQAFALVREFPVAETFYFTSDAEGGHGDWSVAVQFNDGATAKISGTCRVSMPVTEDQALALLKQHGFKDWTAIEERLILPVIRRALMMTANMMSSKESYSDKRVDFLTAAWDQIDNGIYVTKDVTERVADPVSGQMVTKNSKAPVMDKDGQKVREHNPLKGTGIALSNFEIKNFIYDDKVQRQITEQQQALMDVQTARANSLKAEQDALTTESQGKAAVMKAKYEREQEKIRAVTDAEKEKEVAIVAAQKLVEVASKDKEQALIAANKMKEVATIELEAAKMQKQKAIEIGTGEAEAKKLVLAADGALTQKLEAYKAVNATWADAFAKRAVPTTVIGGSEKVGSDASTFMDLLTVKTAKDLALDMGVKTGAIVQK